MNKNLELKATLPVEYALKYKELEVFTRENSFTESDLIDEFFELYSRVTQEMGPCTEKEYGVSWDGYVVPEEVGTAYTWKDAYIPTVFQMMSMGEGLAEFMSAGFSQYGTFQYPSAERAENTRAEAEESAKYELEQYRLTGQAPLHVTLSVNDFSDEGQVLGAFLEEGFSDEFSRICESVGSYTTYDCLGRDQYSIEQGHATRKNPKFVSLIETEGLLAETEVLVQLVDYASKRTRTVLYDPFGKIGVLPQREVW